MGERFEYNYDAPTQQERQEIESIRNQYLPKNKHFAKLERLKKLDNKVKNTPLLISLNLGIIGCLIFGLGLTFILEWDNIFLGLIFGFVGVIPMVVSYPVYVKILNHLKNKYGQEIIELSNELLNEEQ